MDGNRTPDPARVVAGSVAFLGDALRYAAGTTLDLARRVPGVDAGLALLESRGAETLRAADAVVDRVLREVVRRVVAAALTEVDITAVVREHVDLDAIAEGIDIERIVDRVDIERIVDRVDVDAIAARVDIAPILDRVDVDAVAARVDIERIVDRVDVNAIAAKVDVDRIAASVDVDAVIGRVDLVGLSNEVIEGVDLPRIIRESTSTMSTEAVRGARSQGMAADDAVAGFVGRLFGREEREGRAGDEA
ncbi:hypothetical protein [Prescottella equi]|uniref:Uncharacterized protein n=1 Tax=Rhodococcus hoagii TaxID=43767 RepID=A0AAE5IT12_RHOHA|nr:hypothetical protein [Prescottella equi]AVP70060.1 hypothetical protein C7H75_20350 [Prescottella equi]ERN43995.1 hypothetical protein H849_20045 [Prescottella equi NBRC 101255 = C 7]MBM4629710.1 hypothetical protein [Prescottella equi]ORL26077.1 hypothetical protein A6I89_15580 [Prescottella equi]ORL84737.1 hypothetical protein A5905_01675 [Prescottella equi]